MRTATKMLTAACALGALLVMSAAFAQSTTQSSQTAQAPAGDADPIVSIDEERLIERVKEAVIQDLRKDGFLDAEIDKGIRAYVQKQREAQQAARAAQEQRAVELAKNVRPVSAGRDHIRGNPEAVVSLIEYSDFECPYCKRFHPEAQKVVDASGGKVNWVYRHYPLAFHNPGAQKQAEASECAAELGGNDAFWRYADALYEKTRSGGKGFPLDQLVPLAREIGLDGDAFQSCLESGAKTARVTEDLEEGASVGVTGTPGNILLNNETGEVEVIRGAASADAVQAVIDRLL